MSRHERDSRGHLETILLVDDHASVRKLIGTVLVRHGYTVLDASDGHEAIRIGTEYQGPIHLLLTDVVMPKISGPDVADRLMTLRPNVRVVYMSGYMGDALLKRLHLARCDGFMKKPFDLEELLRNVRTALDAASRSTA